METSMNLQISSSSETLYLSPMLEIFQWYWVCRSGVNYCMPFGGGGGKALPYHPKL